MFSLLQIIVYLNTINPPEANVLSHFTDLDLCNKKLYETKERAQKEGFKTIDNIRVDNHNYLKIVSSDKKAVAYWYCKETVFYKKS